MTLPRWVEDLKHCPDGPEHCKDMTNQEINEAVAVKLGWTAWQEGPDPKNYIWVDPHGNESNDGCPDYCTSIAAAWELTKYVPFTMFETWPVPKELCEEFVKLER